MSLSDIKDILDISSGLTTPLLIYIAWLIWRIYSNHLPHFQRSIDSVDKRLARLEGRQEERDHDHTRSAWQV